MRDDLYGDIRADIAYARNAFELGDYRFADRLDLRLRRISQHDVE